MGEVRPSMSSKENERGRRFPAASDTCRWSVGHDETHPSAANFWVMATKVVNFFPFFKLSKDLDRLDVDLEYAGCHKTMIISLKGLS